MTSNTLIGVKNRPGESKQWKPGWKQVSRAEQPLGAARASPEGARAVCAEGPPAPLCDTWQQ